MLQLLGHGLNWRCTQVEARLPRHAPHSQAHILKENVKKLSCHAYMHTQPKPHTCTHNLNRNHSHALTGSHFLANYKEDKAFALVSEVDKSEPPKSSKMWLALALLIAMIATQVRVCACEHVCLHGCKCV